MRHSHLYKVHTIALLGAVFLTILLTAHSNFSYSDNDLFPPGNDMFADAEQIAGTRDRIPGSNSGATLEPNEVYFFKGENSVWYKWTAPANLSMTFEVAGNPDGSPGLAVFDGPQVGKLQAVGFGQFVDRVTFIAEAGKEYSIQVTSKSPGDEGMFLLYWDINAAESWKQFNFDGPVSEDYGLETGKSDFAIYRWWTIMTSGGTQWWIWQSNSQSVRVDVLGILPLRLTPGDYDGDGAVDIGGFDSMAGLFRIYESRTKTLTAYAWGMEGDIPLQGDFDGDDVADVAIWRPSDGTFWIRRSTDGTAWAVQLGMTGDRPVCGDYDGDGKTDLAVKRGHNEEAATYYVLRSSDYQLMIAPFGYGNDWTVPGDYDGDGKNDLAVFRESNNTFYYLRSSDGTARIQQFYWPANPYDVVVPGDYYGDSRSDLCIWRMDRIGTLSCYADGGDGPLYTFVFGVQGDNPVANSNVH